MHLVKDVKELSDVIDVYHEGIGEFMRGDCEPCVELLSSRKVSLGNPFGPWAQGFDAVAAAMRQTSPNYRDGRAVSFDRIAEYVDHDVAYIVEVENLEAKVAGRDFFQAVPLRATSIFHKEDGTWRLVHRHVDLTNSVKQVCDVIVPLTESEILAPAR